MSVGNADVSPFISELMMSIHGGGHAVCSYII